MFSYRYILCNAFSFSGLAHYFYRFDVQYTVSSEERVSMLERVWVPPETFRFPSSGNPSRQFQHGWLQRFKWLAYSAAEDGAFCKYCVLFHAQIYHERRCQRPGPLVEKKYNQWQSATGDFTVHEILKYHQNNVKFVETLLKTPSSERTAAQVCCIQFLSLSGYQKTLNDLMSDWMLLPFIMKCSKDKTQEERRISVKKRRALWLSVAAFRRITMTRKVWNLKANVLEQEL